jgi:diaminobutyrate-2-oxoglutarate transaminase
VLINEEVDAWKPGEHTGTFRGNNLAFVAATALLEHWSDRNFLNHLVQLETRLTTELQSFETAFGLSIRGRGFIQGIDVGSGAVAREVIDDCFAGGLLMEASGAKDEVLKVMPALTMSEELLTEGLEIVRNALMKVAAKYKTFPTQSGAATEGAAPSVPMGIEL